MHIVSRDGYELVDAYGAIETHESLTQWSQEYCSRAIETYEFDVSLGSLDWEVSTRAKRRAAAVKTPQIDDATVGEPIDWASHSQTALSSGDPPSCTVSLSWRAFESFDRSEWTATLRHELVHVEQFQAYGTTDHGPAFKRRAEAVDAPVRVRRFSTPKYVLSCDGCGETVAHRYRDCKLVRQADSYRSSCCKSPLTCNKFASVDS
ncbi:hypothetical protein C455_07250 [Haloferax larsenii JCM 13917]|nr:hypothetical protein C455_07250 [Haloferax larsenii JCM 13917]